MSDIACPNGIPPWNPPQDGERLAYEGWAEWVQEHGGFSHHMQLIAYRVERSAQVFTDALVPALKNVAESISKFMRTLETKP